MKKNPNVWIVTGGKCCPSWLNILLPYSLRWKKKVVLIPYIVIHVGSEYVFINHNPLTHLDVWHLILGRQMYSKSSELREVKKIKIKKFFRLVLEVFQHIAWLLVPKLMIIFSWRLCTCCDHLINLIYIFLFFYFW